MSTPSGRFHLRAIATAPGAHSYPQGEMHADFRARVSRIPGAESLFDKIKATYDNSAVDTRHLEFSLAEIDKMRETMGWHPIVRKTLLSLGKRAIERVFAAEGAGAGPADCDAIVVVSSNYDGFPGLSRQLAEAIGFRQNALFYDLGSLGCGGANHGINLAHMLMATGQCKTVCVLCMDALGTHIQARRYKQPPSVSEIVARVLPSDGAVAMLLSTEPGPRPAFSYGGIDFKLYAWRNSADYMVATTDDDGEPFGHIGKDIRNRLIDESFALLGGDVLDDPICVHPGGIALVRRIAEFAPKLGRTAGISLDVLRENGNMSAPTVLFVLARALQVGLPIEPRLRLLAFGPGVYTTLLCFQDVATSRV